MAKSKNTLENSTENERGNLLFTHEPSIGQFKPHTKWADKVNIIILILWVFSIMCIISSLIIWNNDNARGLLFGSLLLFIPSSCIFFSHYIIPLKIFENGLTHPKMKISIRELKHKEKFIRWDDIQTITSKNISIGQITINYNTMRNYRSSPNRIVEVMRRLSNNIMDFHKSIKIDLICCDTGPIQLSSYYKILLSKIPDKIDDNALSSMNTIIELYG